MQRASDRVRKGHLDHIREMNDNPCAKVSSLETQSSSHNFPVAVEVVLLAQSPPPQPENSPSILPVPVAGDPYCITTQTASDSTSAAPAVSVSTPSATTSKRYPLRDWKKHQWFPLQQ